MNDADHKDADRKGARPAPDVPDAPKDPIETVLRLTGPRPVVPIERADRVRTAVHAHWRGVVDVRAKRRRLRSVAIAAAAVAAAAVAVAVVGRGAWLRPGAPDSVEARSAGSVEAAQGSVRVGTAAAVHPGLPVVVGAELSTEGSEGRLAVRMLSGHSVRLGAGTLLRVLSPTEIALQHGVVYVDSRSTVDSRSVGDPSSAAGPPSGSLAIVTLLGSVREMGTQYEVRTLDASVRVRVREGAVSLEHTGGAFEVAAGHEAEFDAGGEIHRGDLTAFDSEWGWVSKITPMMEIGGRPLREFLDWAARERGLAVRFASSELASSASRITLNGSIDGMTIDQALESVLPTCGMAHHIDRGVLVVEPATESRRMPKL